MITRLRRQGRLVDEHSHIPHQCSCDSGLVVRFCEGCGMPFDEENHDHRARAHEITTGHPVREHVFCDDCHRLVARGLKIRGEYYWHARGIEVASAREGKIGIAVTIV